ncbi:hypothetical protein [Faecalibacterium sp. An121]|uniref:hypothetical protein n=1 Tax=Faecalibacterium sp. An121 TaxID=1965550 RepID=UPI00117BDBBD|nr:hypothetical protein [Faecalibacterium sp. An121]
MKLKKIASLALAGIMAVSMLAGCKDGTTEDGGASSQPETPVVSNAAEYANYMLSGPEKNIFTFSSNSDLDAKLKKVVEKVDLIGDTLIENAYKTNYVVGETAGSNIPQKVGPELDKEFSNKVFVTTGFNTVPSVSGDRIAIDTYAVSGKLSEEDAVKSIVKTWAGTSINTTTYPSSVSGYDCDYKAEISAVNVASRQHPDQSVWVVAIMVTQTSVQS